MNMTTWIAILILCIPLGSHSQGYELDKSKNFRILKNLTIQGGEAVVLVHGGGHTAGQPFQVELRVRCEGGEKLSDNVIHWPVRDSFAVCQLEPDSLKINRAGTALALKTKVADLDTYYDKVAEGDVDAQIQCAEATRVRTFSLTNLCS